MRPIGKQPYLSRSWVIALLIGAVFILLEWGIKFEVEGAAPLQNRSKLDLALFLVGYLFIFCLKPIQAAIHRKLCRRALSHHRQKA
ncbi:hypothetical protein ACW9H6_24130 [Pseudomonas sp. SDO528_S397]